MSTVWLTSAPPHKSIRLTVSVCTCIDLNIHRLYITWVSLPLCDYIPVQCHGKPSSGLLFYLLWGLIIPVVRIPQALRGVNVCVWTVKQTWGVWMWLQGSKRKGSAFRDWTKTMLKKYVPAWIVFLSPLLCTWLRRTVCVGRRKAIGACFDSDWQTTSV